MTVGDTTVSPSWHVIVESASEIGERPVWDSRSRTLVWPDILAGRMHRSAPSPDPDVPWLDTAVTLGAVVGAVALRHDGGLVAAVDSAVRFVDDLGFDDADPLEVPIPSGHRFNDGACDPAGRFLIGTGGSTATGVLLSVDRDRHVRVVLDGVTESNGLGWSPDGRAMYYIDSGEPVVRAYVYDAETGAVGGRLPDLVDLSDRPGVPDGLVVDALGQVWVPQWQGAELACFGADGVVRTRWDVPVSQPTCPGFSGPGLDQLVLASGWEGMTTEQRMAEPWAGHLLAARQVRVPGREAYRFGTTR